MRELNRLGITSAIDAGGGFQNYPDDYKVVNELHEKGQMTIRIAYNLFTQRPQHELEDFQEWTASASLYQGDHTLRLNGAGEMLVFSAADFEDFLEPRPDLEAVLEAQVMGPPDIEQKVGLTGGHILQGECLPGNMWSRRFAARTSMPGVYLCGACTHPGGSVIAMNGRNAAMAVLKDIERGG